MTCASNPPEWVKLGPLWILSGMATIAQTGHCEYDVSCIKTSMHECYLATAYKLLDLFEESNEPAAVAVFKSFAMQVIPALQAHAGPRIDLQVTEEYGTVVVNNGKEVQRHVQTTVRLTRKI
ncbi:hypothetical protein [Achromobacter phage Motura]|uniref:Uncharacterized protein n=1 Tax=Achromobacter phage Motura TaxID=2591403 RepID=A0A514CT99_9CAUD|nr:hypothetical protein H1O15_gp080 [Achromobacter phage Motura]QDH83670.1 hypothetical protein [Achromobacter phage Motura]